MPFLVFFVQSFQHELFSNFCLLVKTKRVASKHTLFLGAQRRAAVRALRKCTSTSTVVHVLSSFASFWCLVQNSDNTHSTCPLRSPTCHLQLPALRSAIVGDPCPCPAIRIRIAGRPKIICLSVNCAVQVCADSAVQVDRQSGIEKLCNSAKLTSPSVRYLRGGSGKTDSSSLCPEVWEYTIDSVTQESE
jgi:hypothetical protein